VFGCEAIAGCFLVQFMCVGLGDVGNRCLMAALDAGCARTTRPHCYAYALVNDAQAMKIVFTPLLAVSLCLLPVLSFSSSFSHHFTSSSSLFFLQLNTINYDLHLCIIHTLYLRLSLSIPLRKTLTVNHYLRIEYFKPGCRKYSMRR